MPSLMDVGVENLPNSIVAANTSPLENRRKQALDILIHSLAQIYLIQERVVSYRHFSFFITPVDKICHFFQEMFLDE